MDITQHTEFVLDVPLALGASAMEPRGMQIEISTTEKQKIKCRY